MVNPQDFYDALINAGFDYFTGVPDSLLKELCACISDNVGVGSNLIAANEGGSVALAAGHYLATGRCGVVYMQNSGLGNAVNSLTSLTDPEVYSIPLLLLIGWRGEPGRSDEPQHVKQGRITRALLDCLEIPHEVLSDSLEQGRDLIDRAAAFVRERQAPFAIVVRAGTFSLYGHSAASNVYEMRREDAVREIAANLGMDDVIVATTGRTSRELFEYRVATGGGHSRDFLTVGSMGHASQIAMAIAQEVPERQVVCLDGDGAAIMHMGSMAIIGSHAPENFKHIVINNGAHDSVGGQPTAGHAIDFPAVARACGYSTAFRCERKAELAGAVARLQREKGAVLLEILTNKGGRADLGRPTIPPLENKREFMRNLCR